MEIVLTSRWTSGIEVALHATTAFAKRAVSALVQWRKAMQQRRALLALDDRMLKDIGISRTDAWRAADEIMRERGR